MSIDAYDLSGGLVTFTPHALLSPTTVYEATVTVWAGGCVVERSWSFTTSSLGSPIPDESALVGKAWDLEVDLAGIISVELQVGVETFETDSVGAKVLELVLASSSASQQDTCLPTSDSTAVDFSQSPAFEARGGSHTFDLGGAQVQMREWQLEGIFAADLETIGAVAFEAAVDVVSLASAGGMSVPDVCSLYDAVGTPCEPCPDDAGALCVPFTGGGTASALLSAVIPVAADETENHLCLDLCTNGIDDDGDDVVDGDEAQCNAAVWP